MPETPRILLAEDDLNLGILLVDFLESEGFEVKLCRDGELASSVYRAQQFDLCLLDVMMPKMDGFALAKAIRSQNPNIPIIFITARSLKEDKQEGYELGADDYVTKPFDEEELLWKIRAHVRRLPARDLEVRSVQLASYTFDIVNQCLVRKGSVKRITGKECEVLQFLSANQNRLVKREEILTAIWGENDYFLGRSLDVFITKIRRYLKDDPRLCIENVFGVGFILNVSDEKPAVDRPRN